jgi:hypothetical protein
MMSQLANDAKSIALSTGVTGDELLAAMKSSEGALKNLRNQGNMTSAAAKNIIEAMTVAKKLGVEDKAAGVLDMLTSTNKFLEGDAKTRNFILKMAGNVPGGSRKAMSGTLMNDSNAMKGLVKEMDKTIEQFTGGQAKSVKDMENLGENERMRLSMLLQNVFGMEIYEYEGMYKSLEAQTKTLGDKFSDLAVETNAQLYTTEQVRLAYQKMNDLMVGSGMTFANKFANATSKIKDASDFQAAMAKTNAQMTEAEKLDMIKMKELAKKSADQGGLGMTDADFTKTAGFGESKEYADSLLIAAKAMQKQGKDKGIQVDDLSGEILKAFESGDVVAIKEVQEKIAKQQKELGVKEKTGVDAIAELAQNINSLNEVIRKYISKPIGFLIDKLGWVGLALAQVGIASGLLYIKFGDFTKRAKSLFGSVVTAGENMKAGAVSIFDTISRKRITESAKPFAGMSGTMGESIAKNKNNFTNIFSRMADRFAWFFGEIANIFEGNFKNIRKGASGALGVISKTWDFFFGRLIKRLKLVKNPITGIANAIGRIPNAIGTALNGMFKFTGSIFNFRSILTGFMSGIRGLGSAIMFLIKSACPGQSM